MKKPIIVVAGLPRSGTSMMMKMLEKGGVDIVTDKYRKADLDNPGGYYELEKVKQVETDTAWLFDMQGKAFKMVSMLLMKLPEIYKYKVIFIHRDIQEVLISQEKMLDRLGKQIGPNNASMAEFFSRHLSKVEKWLSNSDNFDVLNICYADIIASSRTSAQQIAKFIGLPLDISLMSAVVDVSLYRNRN